MRLEDVYDPLAEQAALAAVLDPRYTRMLVAVHELVASAMPEAQDFRLDDEAARMILEEAATRVVLIDQATQDALRAQLKVGQARGYSAYQVAHGVPEEDYPGIDGLFRVTWKGRSEQVSRTELANAQVTSSLNRYAATGLVTRVQLVENTDTDEPCASRNGRIVPIGEQPGLLHPNCRLSTIPILDEAPA
jgi:hypothetical protein